MKASSRKSWSTQSPQGVLCAYGTAWDARCTVCGLHDYGTHNIINPATSPGTRLRCNYLRKRESSGAAQVQHKVDTTLNMISLHVGDTTVHNNYAMYFIRVQKSLSQADHEERTRSRNTMIFALAKNLKLATFSLNTDVPRQQPAASSSFRLLFRRFVWCVFAELLYEYMGVRFDSISLRIGVTCQGHHRLFDGAWVAH